MYLQLESYVENISIADIEANRSKILMRLVDYVQEKVNKNEEVRLNFICTHNSRRSHLSQIWAQTMAYYFGLSNIYCYSAGTEATAIFPMIVQTLLQSGFRVEKLVEKDNPIYAVKFSPNECPIIAFSKRIDAFFNPETEFCAIMTCDSAEEACPIIGGAEKRISILYEDPKQFDNSSQQVEKYKERSAQIATEMYFVFSQIKTP